jgi:hypothetical protein
MNAISEVVADAAPVRTPLYGHTSEATALLVEDYPYSFTLRCRIRYWIERHTKRGYRFVSQTENPKTMRWNTPKKSTYSELAGAMFRDEKGHVHWTGISMYSSGDAALDFVKAFPESDFSLFLDVVKVKIVFLSRGPVAWKINGTIQEITNRAREEHAKDLAAWREIGTLLGVVKS